MRLLIAFGWQHFRRHWRLLGVVFIALLIGTSLLASLPLFATVIASDNLNLTLANVGVPSRNLEVTSGDSPDERAFLNAELSNGFGDQLREVVEVRRLFTEIFPVNYKADGSEVSYDELLRLRLYSFSNFAAEIEVDMGRLPTTSLTSGAAGEPIIEVVVGADLAAAEQLDIGDEFAAINRDLRFQVVGIVRPGDPVADVWWGDSALLPFNSERIAGQIDTLIFSMIAHPEIVATLEGASLTYQVHIDTTGLDQTEAMALRDKLLNLNALLAARRIIGSSRLVDILNRYEAELNDARVSLLLLTVQSVLAVLYTIGMVSSFLLEQARSELATMAGRGFSAGQITWLYGGEALILSLGMAFPLGPPLALAFIQIWARSNNLPFGSELPALSWWLALSAALFGWLAVVIPIYISSHRQLSAWTGLQVRPPQRPSKQRIVIDLVLLGLGALAYWQLRTAGSLTQEVAASELLGASDPILLLGPTLLVLAIALIILRLFPFLLQGLAYLGQLVRNLTLPLSLSRLARDPAGPSRILLLISLTAGLTLFATIFRDSIEQRQEEMALYRSGSDLRVIVPLDKRVAETDINQLLSLGEGLVGSPVYRNQINVGSPDGRRVSLIAVDPNSFAEVATFPQGFSQFSLEQIMAVLAPADFESEEALLIPAVFSVRALPAGYRPGEVVPLSLGDQTWGYEIRGVISDFPIVAEPFIVVNINELEKRIDVTAADVLLKGLSGVRELWLQIPPEVDASELTAAIRQSPPPIIGATAEASRISGDAVNLLSRYRANLIAREAIAAFNINAVILAVLSSIGFLLIQVFMARRRMVEFGILRALGLNNNGLLRILTVEAVILLCLGLLLGSGIGLGLAAIMRPFISTILSDALGGEILEALILNPFSLISVIVTLLLFYGLAMGILLYSLRRTELQRVLRLGDE